MNVTVASETLSSCLSKTNAFVSGITTCALSAIGLAENVAVIFFIAFRNGFLNAPSNVFLLSLATADGLMCTVVTTLHILSFFHEWMLELYLKVGKFLSFTILGSVILLNLDKFVSVKWPLRYSTRMTVFRSVILVAAIWTVALVAVGTVLSRYLTGEIWLQEQVKYIAVMIIIMVLLVNVYLFKKSREHKRRIKAQFHAVSGNFISLQRDFRAIKTILLITGTFLVGWLPLVLSMLLFSRFTEPCSFYRALSYAIPFIAANAALDPVIYCFRSNEFKQAYGCFIRKLRSKLGLRVTSAHLSAFVVTSRVIQVASSPV